MFTPAVIPPQAVLFANVEELVALHDGLLAAMQNIPINNITRVFADARSSFASYSTYSVRIYKPSPKKE